MIKLTIDQLVKAAYMGSLKRFFACGLAMPAWKALRHTAEACEKEVAAFEKKRDELVAKYEGKVRPDKNGWEFGKPEQAQVFGAEFEELLRTEVEAPGSPIKQDDVQTGSLTGEDGVRLAPFLVDE